MPDILHQIGIKASPDEIYELLTTDAGLSRWWTSTTTGAGKPGSIIDFCFGETCVQFEVTELIPTRFVRWTHHGDIPEAWTGTEVSFDLSESGQQTFVLFKHSHWKTADAFMAHCSTKWAVFLLSLKDALEVGTGKPFPNDTHIDHNE